MRVVNSNVIGPEILKALGISIDNVTGLTINIEAGQAATVSVRRMVGASEAQPITEIFKLYDAGPDLGYHPEEENLHV